MLHFGSPTKFNLFNAFFIKTLEILRLSNIILYIFYGLGSWAKDIYLGLKERQDSQSYFSFNISNLLFLDKILGEG